MKNLLSILSKDGIFMMLWGWIMAHSYALYYINYSFQLNFSTQSILRAFGFLIPVFGLAITLFYIWGKKDRFQEKNGFVIVAIWLSVLMSMVLINLILANVMNDINFTLQHPIFMVITALGIIVTGINIKYGYLIVGGLIFGVLAYVASFFELNTQLLIESVGWLMAMAIPGHIKTINKI